MKQLFYKHLASSNNDKFGDTDIIVPIFYWGNHNVSWVQIIFQLNLVRLVQKFILFMTMIFLKDIDLLLIHF